MKLAAEDVGGDCPTSGDERPGGGGVDSSGVEGGKRPSSCSVEASGIPLAGVVFVEENGAVVTVVVVTAAVVKLISVGSSRVGKVDVVVVAVVNGSNELVTVFVPSTE